MKRVVSGLMFTLLLIDVLTFAFSVQMGKTEDVFSEDSNTKDVEGAINQADEGSSGNLFDHDRANEVSNSSYSIEERNEATKEILVEWDEWSALEIFFDFWNSSESWKKEIEPKTKALDDSFRFDNDSVELVVGLDWSINDVTFVLSNLVSEYEVSIVNEVSAGDETLAFVMDAPYQTLQSFTSVLRTSNFVRYVEPNMRFEISYSPNDPDWSLQWGPEKIRADDAWDIQVGSSDVLVAVIDTGIDWNHPDLADNYVPLGYDWVNDDSDPMDDHGHGTHVAGVIAAVLNNSVGIAGLAQVRIMAEKGLNAWGYGWHDDLANAITHAVDQGAHILSNSWGSYGASSLIQDAVRYAQDHGVLVLAAAGNGATDQKHYPAAFDEVVAVTATDSSDLPASFTNFGDWVEVAAPGVNIYSTVWDDSYTYMSGTSMATPHVAGVAALIWSQFPEKTLSEVRNHLKFTADDLGSPGFDEYYGYGRINALKAVHPPPAHELLILSQETPFIVELGNQARINTTVFNYGTHNETNVEVQLQANGSIVESYTIPHISTGTSETISLSWTPPADAIYNMTSYIVPVPDENNTANNAASALMRACIPINVLWDDVHDNDGDSLLGNYFSLYKTLSLQGYAVTEHTSGLIDSTLLSDYSILVLMDPETDFSSSEIDDIQNWVDNGGKLLVIPDAGWPSTLNSLLAPYGIQVTDGRSWGGVTTDIAYHPITEDVESVYYSAAYDLDVDPSRGRAMALAWTIESYEFLSISDRVVVLSDSNIMDNSRLGKSDNEKLMTNIFTLIGAKSEHDLSVSLEAPSLVSPGESSELNATVYNVGLHNETDVKLELYIEGSKAKFILIPNLVNASSYTFSYLWTPLDEGIYNLTVHSPPVADENVTVNNVYSVNVRSAIVPEMRVALFKDADPWGYEPNEEVLSFYGIPYEVYSSNDFGSVDLDTFDKVIIASAQYQWFYDEMNTYAWWFEDYVARGGLLEIHAADGGWYGGHWKGTIPGGLGWTQSGSNYVSIVNVTHPVVTKPFLITDDELDGWGWSVHGYFDAFPEWSQFVINEDSTSLPAYLEFSYGRGTVVASSQTLEWGYSHGYSNMLENSILYKPKVHSFTHELFVYSRSPNLLLLGESSQINATVYNLGLYNETDVELFLLVNDIVVSSLTIPQLDSDTSQSSSYLWTPTVTGRYNVTAYALPVPGENFTANNVATKLTAVTNILIYTDDAYTTASQRYPIVALDNLGITYVHYASDPSGFGTALTSYPWSLVIVSHNNYFAVGNYWDELEAYVLEGGRLILSTFDVDGSHSESTTLWSTLGAEWISDMSSPEPFYRWTPTHPIFTKPNRVGDLTPYFDGYFDNGDHIRATTGTAVSGFTSTPSEDSAAIVFGESARTLLISFLLSEFRYDEDADGKLDAVELWENAITYIYAREWDVILTTTLGGYSDVSEFGVRSEATEGFDPTYDELDPPPSPVGVASYFWYPDNPTSPVDLRKLSTSKITPSRNMTWTYEVKPAGIDGLMHVSWTAQDIAAIPSNYSVHLLNSEGVIVANMRDVTEYSFAAELDTTYTLTIWVRIAKRVEITFPTNNHYFDSESGYWINGTFIEKNLNLTRPLVINHTSFMLADWTWDSTTYEGTFAFRNNTVIADGHYYVIVTLTDLAGASTSDVVYFHVDTVKPIVTITFPEDGHYYNSETVIWINGTFTEKNFDIAGLSINGTFTYVTHRWNSTTHEGIFAFKNTTALSDDTYHIEVSITDLAGKTGFNTVYFTVDTSPPNARARAHRRPAGDVSPDQSVKVSVNVTDAVSGVKNVTLYYTLNNGTTWEEPILMSLNASSSLYEATIPDQRAGAYVQFKIVVYDNAGNQAVDDNTGEYYVYLVTSGYQFQVIVENTTFNISVKTNSTISNFAFDKDAKTISFNVEGESGTGFFNLTISVSLLGGPYTIRIDNMIVLEGYDAPTNETHAFIYFTYSHSTHKIEIFGTVVVQEFPQIVIMPLFIVTTLLAVFLLRKRNILSCKQKGLGKGISASECARIGLFRVGFKSHASLFA